MACLRPDNIAGRDKDKFSDTDKGLNKAGDLGLFPNLDNLDILDNTE